MTKTSTQSSSQAVTTSKQMPKNALLIFSAVLPEPIRYLYVRRCPALYLTETAEVSRRHSLQGLSP